MDSTIYTLILATLIGATYTIYRRSTRISLADVPCPESKSFVLGHYDELSLPECNVTESKWQAKFGPLFRFKGAFGEDRLYVADPKALHHILQRGGYHYIKVPGDNAVKVLSAGHGLFWAEGNTHKLYRKCGAGIPEPIAFLPVFREAMHQLINHWNRIIAASPSGKSADIDMNWWMTRASLDVIGKGALDHDFKSLDDVEDPLRTAYELRAAALADPPSYPRMVFEAWHNNLPIPVLNFIHRYTPNARWMALRKRRFEMHAILRKYLDAKKAKLSAGREKNPEWEKKDMLTMLLKAQISGDKSRQLREEEIVEIVVSTIFGGHGTIALAMTWVLYEIAKRPEIQARMRAEILEMMNKVHARGDTEWTPLDLDSLHYTDAVVRESFRYSSIIVDVRRQATRDDVLPLSKPITTLSGKVIHELPIPKGTYLFIAVQGYHMDPEIWGDDVLEFKPERWLNRKDAMGILGNFLTFSSGIRSCPGRRFSFVEMQVFLVSLLSNFEFSIPDDARRVVRYRSFAMFPMAEGEMERGPHLPIKISPLST